jgi:pyruvate dehydrogenase E1 component alpha subunit
MQKYRGPGEVERLRETADPLVKFEQRVTADFDVGADELREIDEEIAEIIEDKVAVAKAAAKPSNDALYADVYGSY